MTLAFQSAKAQQITIVNQLGDNINADGYLNVSIGNGDTTVSMLLDKAHFEMPSILCDNKINIVIDGALLQYFYNEYTCSQLSTLDTIVVHQKFKVGYLTPRLLLGFQKNLDSIFFKNLWIKEWLEEYNEVASGISFWVYNCDDLTQKDTIRIKEIIEEYCNKLDLSEHANKIEFKDVAYTTSHEDFFKAGTEMTRKYIENQNTEDMRKIAEEYSLVVMIVIDWIQK